MRIKNYKEFKKKILAVKWYISDDKLQEIANNTGNPWWWSYLWDNAHNRIIEERNCIIEAKKMKEQWFTRDNKYWRGYYVKCDNQLYKVNKIIYDNL